MSVSPRARSISRRVATVALSLLLTASSVVVAAGLLYAYLAAHPDNASTFAPIATVIGLIVAGIAAPFGLCAAVLLYLRRREAR